MSEKSDFVHLHTHSDLSLLDGACKISDLIHYAKQNKMPALALTDHGNLFGTIEFYKTAINNGIKPIIGYEAYVAQKSHKEKSGGTKEKIFHITLLVKNFTGYLNLIKLATIAYRDGFYYKPRIDKELLKNNASGLIALSGCLNSEFNFHLSSQNFEKALDSLTFYNDIFGKGNFYIEIQYHELPEEKKLVEMAIEASKQTEIPLVATNDIHYITKDDYKAHDVLLCIATNKRLDDKDRLRYKTDQLYFKTANEMKQLFKEVPEAITNTIKIAESCSLNLDFSTKHLPSFIPPDNKTTSQYLRELCEEGLRQKNLHTKSVYIERLNYELETVERMGLSGYFLIVWDIVSFAKKNNIPVGPGRGSAAGSLIAYTLDITQIDPIKNSLLFERFLNPGRNELPDIDIDFCEVNREKVINYIHNKYGKDNVAQIITFGSMKARAVLRDVGRILGFPYQEIDKIAKEVPKLPNITLREALNQSKELRNLVAQNKRIEELFTISKKLEGLSRHASTHAAGIVIADKPLINYLSFYSVEGSESTQYPMQALQDLGLLKMDILGLKTLSIIQKCVELIEKTTGEKIDPRNLPLNNKKTYELLSKGETAGIFQLESQGMRDLIRRLKPDRFEDIIALLALYRPGPIRSGMVEQFLSVKHKEKEVEYLHPSLEPILKETYGVVIYQEQIMLIANKLANFSLSEADALRKAMGKKKPEIVASYKEKFIEGATKNKIQKEIAMQIFDWMENFAEYGFNKSHTAAYAFISYQTAYLKANYPLQFFTSLLCFEHKSPESKIPDYIEEAKKFKIEILPPDINKSNEEFTIEGKNKIRFGYLAIKDVGSKAIQNILEVREKCGGRFESFLQFCELVDSQMVNKSVIEALIKSGAFDSLGYKRSQLMIALEDVMEISQSIQRQKKSGQISLFASQPAVSEVPAHLIPDVPEWDEETIVKYEQEAFGFPFTLNPLAKHKEIISMLVENSISDIQQSDTDIDDVLIAGMITQITSSTIKTGMNKGKRKYSVTLKDFSSSINIIIFPKEYEKCAEYIKEGNIIFVRGSFSCEEKLIKASSLISLQKGIETLSEKMELVIRLNQIDEDKILEMKRVIMANKGNTPVYFRLYGEGDISLLVKADPAFKVTCTEDLISTLNNIGGKVITLESLPIEVKIFPKKVVKKTPHEVYKG